MSIRLRAYFAICFAIGVFILTAILSYAIGSFSTSVLKREVGGSLSEVAYQMVDKLDYFMWSRYSEIQILGELETFKNPENPQEIQQILNHLKTSIPSFSWVGFTNEKGQVLVATDGILKGADISERPVFQNALSKPFIGDVHDAVLLSKLLPNPTGEPLQFVDISTPIMNNENQFIGVLAAHFSWEWTEEIKKSILEPLKGTREDVEVFIVSKKDKTVILGPKDLIGKPLKLEGIDFDMQKNSWDLVTWPDGNDYVTGFAYGTGYKDYNGLGWTVIVRQPEELAFVDSKNLQRFILTIGIISSIIFAFIGWIVSSRISKPLFNIEQAARLLKTGKIATIPVETGIKDIEVLSSTLRELVSELTKTESALGKMQTIAHHDELTGLPNRMALNQYIQDFLMKENRSGKSYMMLFMDLDGFKRVNDEYGHHMGDQLLIHVGQRIKEAIPDHAFLARLGGDEFVIVLDSADNHSEIVSTIIRNLNTPFNLSKYTITISCSIGGALWSVDHSNPDHVLQLADKALYASKNSGKNKVTYHNQNMKDSEY
ncbi:sensor domain-containing diguanylate cyclase [Peribacillus acanthi]|uniref:sensor domain-containing diguanylate cyclase n=1 Tax=Peribacillus acanthi TaxID=2171554 RepID=UPI000D3EE09F|nr:sensor domain-containing diguanylate cyclase [Peribacillus acanthi]